MTDLHGTGLGVYDGSAVVLQRNERLRLVPVSSCASPSFEHGEEMAETARRLTAPVALRLSAMSITCSSERIT